METNKEQFNSTQQGSGSAENRGQDRSSQVADKTDLSNDERKDVAAQIGEDPGHVSSIKEMGGLSGRDDSSGGTGDRMEGQNTGQATDRDNL